MPCRLYDFIYTDFMCSRKCGINTHKHIHRHSISLKHIFHCGEFNFSLGVVVVFFSCTSIVEVRQVLTLYMYCMDKWMCVGECIFSFNFSLQLYDVICHFMVFVCFQLQIEKFSSLDAVFASNFPLKTLNACNM